MAETSQAGGVRFIQYRVCCRLLLFFHKGKVVVTGDKRDLYNEDLYKYIKCPKIIEFIKMVKDKDINLSNYLDINELIKGIYRSVEGK